MKNKSVTIGIIIVLVVGAIAAVVLFTGKEKHTPSNIQVNVTTNTVTTQNKVVENSVTQNNTTGNNTQGSSKSEQKGTAGSNMPLKDNPEEARIQIETAMKKLIKETYGDEVVDSKVTVTKIYSETEEKKEEALKERNLGPDEVAFEVQYELKLADSVKDPMVFTAATGDYNASTKWVTNKFNLGILRPDGNGYKITDFGTGW